MIDEATNQAEEQETAPEQPEVEEQPASEEEQANSLLEEFLVHFSTVVEKQDREKKLRATKAGYFLEESLLDMLVSSFVKWYQAQVVSGGSLSSEKALKKLFDTEAPVLAYVLEGKHSMIGYVVPVEMPQPQKAGVQLYHGQPLDAVNYLHPRDPLIDSVEGMKSGMGKQGLEFSFQVGKREYKVAMPQLIEFAHIARGSRRVCSDYPKLVASLREALKVLPALLGKARPSRKKQALLIPGRFRTDKQVVFLTVGSFVFVVNKTGEFLLTYDLKGKNRHEFITAEYDFVRRMRKGPRVEGLELVKNPKARFLAYYKLQGQKYQLLPKAFGDFVESAPLTKEFGEKLSPYFTIFDCVKSCAEVFMQSSIVDSRDTGKYLKDRKYSDVKYLRIAKGFAFVVNKKQVILDCFHVELSRKLGPPKNKKKSKGSPAQRK